MFDSVREMAQHVDVVAIFNPNFCRVDVMEEIARAVRDGARLRGLICEKPLARNLAEARRVVELAREIGAPTAYFENQIHMKMLQNAREQLAPVTATMGPLTLARAAEEHAGPHSGWFWDPTLQGGGVLSDMGCHRSRSVGTCSRRRTVRSRSSSRRPSSPTSACSSGASRGGGASSWSATASTTPRRRPRTSRPAS